MNAMILLNLSTKADPNWWMIGFLVLAGFTIFFRVLKSSQNKASASAYAVAILLIIPAIAGLQFTGGFGKWHLDLPAVLGVLILAVTYVRDMRKLKENE